MESYSLIGIFAILGILYVGGAILVSRILGPKGATGEAAGKKFQPYECGIDPTGSARIQFRIGYYLFALVFMVFDVESLFLFPCAKIFNAVASPDSTLPEAAANIGQGQILIELLVFVSILGLGLIFAWRKKVLEWE